MDISNLGYALFSPTITITITTTITITLTGYGYFQPGICKDQNFHRGLSDSVPTTIHEELFNQTNPKYLPPLEPNISRELNPLDAARNSVNRREAIRSRWTHFSHILLSHCSGIHCSVGRVSCFILHH